tara:strand:+ start:260 stop:724 length:465 start_codon:yes stop_codon:yes gene_type:complete
MIYKDIHNMVDNFQRIVNQNENFPLVTTAAPSENEEPPQQRKISNTDEEHRIRMWFVKLFGAIILMLVNITVILWICDFKQWIGTFFLLLPAVAVHGWFLAWELVSIIRAEDNSDYDKKELRTQMVFIIWPLIFIIMIAMRWWYDEMDIIVFNK